MHGHNENLNESLNHLIWSQLPKNIFVAIKTLKIDVVHSVLTFRQMKEHLIGVAVLEELGISVGSFTLLKLKKLKILLLALLKLKILN